MKFNEAAAALLIAATVLAARPARATEEDAKTFFAEGRRLRMAGDCTNAIVQFRRALEIYPEGLGSLRNIAECEEQQGQFASARNDWWALRRAALQANEAKYAGWEKDAEIAYNRLKNKVGKLTVHLEGERLERVHVTVDGKPLDPRLYDVELERDLGQHNIEATYGGVSPITARKVIAEGGSEVVTLKIPAPSASDVAQPPVVTTPPPSDRSGLRIGGFVAVGIGAASLAGAGISLAIRQSALSEIDATCNQHVNCPNNLQGARDRGQTSSLLVNVLGGVGLLGVGVGAGLLYVGYKKPSDSTSTTTRVGFTPLPGGGFAQTEVRF